MSSSTQGPAFESFMAAAEQAARDRPHVDPEMIREIFTDAASMLHNSLALDGLDERDTDAVVAGLCEALVEADPGAAVRSKAIAAVETPGDLHDPEAAAAAYWNTVTVLRI
jgi:hypothetical protein